MRSIITRFSLAMLILITSVAFASAPFEGLLIYDPVKIRQTATVYEDARQQVNAIRVALEEKNNKEMENFKKLDEQLRKESSSLSPDAMQKKQAELQNKFNAFQRDAQKEAATIEKNLQNAQQKIEDEILKILEAVVIERNGVLLLDKQAAPVVRLGNNVDITAEVIKRLNKSLPKVKIQQK